MNITAQVVLINPEGLVLGVSRKNNHNDFGLIGGKMEDTDNGEPKFTAIRETFEETGLQISNLRLIFAMHKDGCMCYCYLADYNGEVNHNEPHVVKWLAFETLLNGSFGEYNQLVLESLTDMGIKLVERLDLSHVKEQLAVILEKYGYRFVDVVPSWSWGGVLYNEVIFTHGNGELIDEDFDDLNVATEIVNLGNENGIILSVPSYYLPK